VDVDRPLNEPGLSAARTDCKAIQSINWREDNAPVYFVTYRCKKGEITAKFKMDGEGLEVQYLWNQP
jgi:hypothetical protein